VEKPKKNDHRASSFRKTDVTRILKAAIDAGIPNPVAEVDPVTKRIRVSGTAAPKSSSNDLDRELEEFERKNGRQGPEAKHGQGSA
jgi:hypothetical protein